MFCSDAYNHMHAWFPWKLEEASDSLELKLQMVVTHHVLGVNPRARAFNHWAWAPAPLSGSSMIKVDFTFFAKSTFIIKKSTVSQAW